SVQLPRKLSRPPFVEVSRSALVAVSPELSQVPPEFIRQGIPSKASHMLSGTSAIDPSSLPTSLPRAHVPATLTVRLRAPVHTTAAPTHVLAISAPSTHYRAHEIPVKLVPTHSLPLAAHCTAIPVLPPRTRGDRGVLYLQVLPLELPSPAAFPILHNYMYTHGLSEVLSALIPVPDYLAKAELSHAVVLGILQSRDVQLFQLADYCMRKAMNNSKTLLSYASHAKELWQDMVALGLFEPALWDTLDLAWEVILIALNKA
ncbi:hypothetical protein FISHEDRAFT_32117, partial [Fistulina hepatica ATCC 64428]